MSDSAVRGHVAVSRRAATGTDLPLLRELFADARMELAVLPTDTRLVLLDMQFRAQRRQHAAQFPAAEHDIVVVEGAEVGHVVVDRAGEAVRIVDISVSLGRRREGIATAVLSAIVDDTINAHQRVWMTVWSGNVAACRLGERAGLLTAAQQDGYLTMERVPVAAAP